MYGSARMKSTDARRKKINPENVLPPYINLFVGYSNNPYNRMHGSSGGIGTTVLQYLLDEKFVDAVVGVGFDEQDKTKCVYKMVERASQVTELTGSKYVYMKLEPLLHLLRQHNDKRIAVIVEPCFVKAVKKMAPHCTYVLSFFCGYNITEEATDYLIRKAQIDKSNIFSIEYRGGKYPGGFTVHLKNGQSKSFGKENWELVDLLFLGNVCGRCRVFISAEADIVLGDAWIRNLENATLLVLNTKRGNEVIQQMYQKKILTLFDIEPWDVVRMHAHNLKFKNFGHSRTMKFIVKLFNNPTARRFAPFYLLGMASKIRRSLMVGIKKMRLESTRKYENL